MEVVGLETDVCCMAGMLQPRQRRPDMTGSLRQSRSQTTVIETKSLIAKVCNFAVFSSVHGHAQAPVVIHMACEPHLASRSPSDAVKASEVPRVA